MVRRAQYAVLILGLVLGLCLQPALAQEAADESGGNASLTQEEGMEMEAESPDKPEGNASLQQEIIPLTVAEMEFCYDVQDREPVGVNDTFPDTVGRVFCFTRVTGASEETTIHHVWYYQDEVARVDLRVNSPNWRTWSSKQILESQDGWWKVEVVDEQGAVLASRDFFISQTAQ